MGYNAEIEYAIGKIPGTDDAGNAIEMYLLDAFKFDGVQFGVVCSSMVRSPFDASESMRKLHVITYDGDIRKEEITNQAWVGDPLADRVLRHFAENIDADGDRTYKLGSIDTEVE